MAAHGKLGLFFGLILPHGLLELTAVFVAGGRRAAAGLDPGRPRAAPPGRGVAPRRGARPSASRSGWSSCCSSPASSRRSSRRPGCRPGRGSRSACCVVGCFVAWSSCSAAGAAPAGETGDLDAGARAASVLPGVRLSSEPAGGLQREVGSASARRQPSGSRVHDVDAAPAQLGARPASRASRRARPRPRRRPRRRRRARRAIASTRGSATERERPPGAARQRAGQHGQQALLERGRVERGEQHDERALVRAGEDRAGDARPVGLDERRLERRHRLDQRGSSSVAGAP